MKKKTFQVISEFDERNDYGLTIGPKHKECLLLLKQNQTFVPGDFITDNFDKVGKQIERPEDMWQYEKNRHIRRFLDDRRPKIDEMADNIGYLTFINGEVARWRFDTPSFHHKNSLEDFQKDTGINWKVITKKIPKEPTTTNSHQKKKTKEEVLKKINHMHVTDGKSFKQIRDDLVQMQTDGMIPNLGFEDKEPIYFNNLWNRWKKKNEPKTD